MAYEANLQLPNLRGTKHQHYSMKLDKDIKKYSAPPSISSNHPSSPTSTNHGGAAPSGQGGSYSPVLEDKHNPSSVTKKESFKARKQTYKIKKKKVAKEFSTALKDKSVTILSSWLKIRGTLKSWAKYWCVVKPEVIIIYKSNSLHHWVGTILINTCEYIERPSSKDGFCFKIFQPYGQSIWATKGPKGEVTGYLVQPMPKDHLILRASNEEVGRCWLDAIEVAQRSSLVQTEHEQDVTDSTLKIESDIYGDEDEKLQHEENMGMYSEFNGDKSDYSSGEEPHEEEVFGTSASLDEPIEESPYGTPSECEEFGESGETTEEMEEENKSILWALLKQVRPGMDLSKVTLPTFILEPRSFLDKLADYYYHADFLANAAKEENPYHRIKEIVKWYLSGFYKKPKGLKKPYNPIIGEVFRCMWPNEKNQSKTFFLAEQVSHHPPVSAFYCSNRKDGYVIGGSILAKSKFYGNSTSAILDGTATLTLLKLGEDYTVTMPYAHVKGLLIGSITMELGGVVNIRCEKTGYNAEIEFKLKPFWKKSGECNFVSGKIRMGNDVLCKIDGRWDGEIYSTEYRKSSGEEVLPELFFAPTADVKKARLKRYNIDLESQEEFESEKLWAKVSEAIQQADQSGATREKLVLEDEQRRVHKEMKEKDTSWVPKYFERDTSVAFEHAWVYKYKDLRAWDPVTDMQQFEHNGVIKSRTRHRVPMVKRTMSQLNITPSSNTPLNRSMDGGVRLPSIKEPQSQFSDSSRRNSYDRSSLESNRSDEEMDTQSRKSAIHAIESALEKYMKPIETEQKETNKQITAMRHELRKCLDISRANENAWIQPRDCIMVLMFILIHSLLQMYWSRGS
ncbi:oxysterol-binding protein-related protein 8-like isoform X1 [Clytia hemisphaerica]|uniref:oxysterol-binding protein-related protein 8-like isoform X1 n=1 Tax=Clytia hemisphaerica TaxID=252671 RepID=UPI0034D40B15